MPAETLKRAAVSRIDVQGPNDFVVYLKTEDGQELALNRLTGFTLDVQVGVAPLLSLHVILPDVQATALADALVSVTTHEELIERDRLERNAEQRKLKGTAREVQIEAAMRRQDRDAAVAYGQRRGEPVEMR